MLGRAQNFAGSHQLSGPDMLALRLSNAHLDKLCRIRDFLSFL